MLIKKLLFMGIAGGLGTLSRYFLSMFVQKISGSVFPFGTLVVNLSGCFFAGFLWALFETKMPVSAENRTIILVAFMGAFTTFASFILETGHLIRGSEWLFVISNILLQNGLGIVALFLGITLAHII